MTLQEFITKETAISKNIKTHYKINPNLDCVIRNKKTDTAILAIKDDKIGYPFTKSDGTISFHYVHDTFKKGENRGQTKRFFTSLDVIGVKEIVKALAVLKSTNKDDLVIVEDVRVRASNQIANLDVDFSFEA